MGLWQKGHGTVTWNCRLDEGSPCSESSTRVSSAPSRAFFLPQRPYNLLGSLRAQIMYPSTRKTADVGSDAELDSLLLELLEKVELGDLGRRLGRATLWRVWR